MSESTENALRALARDLCAYDISADPVPDGVEVPEEYERGINEAGERLLDILEGDQTWRIPLGTWMARNIRSAELRAVHEQANPKQANPEQASHDSGPDGMRTHMQLPDGGCTCQK